MKTLNKDELMGIQTQMLRAFADFCDANGLRYILYDGTLLGCVRHKGFIPWDDDVDVGMPRDDYEKLLEYERISENNVIVSMNQTHGFYYPVPYACIVNTETGLDEDKNINATGRGVYIDVFPLDGTPKGKTARHFHFSRLILLQSVYSVVFHTAPKITGVKSFVKRILHLLCKPFSPKYIAKRINSVAKKYAFDTSDTVACSVFLGHSRTREVHPLNDMVDTVMGPFEGGEYRIPRNYDAVLTRTYGDYMTPPPENERESAHGNTYYMK